MRAARSPGSRVAQAGQEVGGNVTCDKLESRPYTSVAKTPGEVCVSAPLKDNTNFIRFLRFEKLHEVMPLIRPRHVLSFSSEDVVR